MKKGKEAQKRKRDQKKKEQTAPGRFSCRVLLDPFLLAVGIFRGIDMKEKNIDGGREEDES